MVSGVEFEVYSALYYKIYDSENNVVCEYPTMSLFLEKGLYKIEQIYHVDQYISFGDRSRGDYVFCCITLRRVKKSGTKG